jgi:hypothetical protein
MGKTVYLKIEWILVAGLMLSTVGCSVPVQRSSLPSTNTAEATTEEMEAPTPAETQPVEQPSTEEPADAEPVALNVCDLLTPEEVQSVLGEAPSGKYDPYNATCHYTAGSGRQLIVVAYQGELARARANEGMQLALQYFGNPTAQQLYDGLVPQLPAMTLAQMAEAFSAVEQALGREVTPYPELGDASYLVWIQGRSAQLGVVRGETATSVVTMDVDRANAEPALISLTEAVWSRLPERFTPAP